MVGKKLQLRCSCKSTFEGVPNGPRATDHPTHTNTEKHKGPQAEKHRVGKVLIEYCKRIPKLQQRTSLQQEIRFRPNEVNTRWQGTQHTRTLEKGWEGGREKSALLRALEPRHVVRTALSLYTMTLQQSVSKDMFTHTVKTATIQI